MSTSSSLSPAQRFVERLKRGEASVHAVLLAGSDETERDDIAHDIACAWLGLDPSKGLANVVDCFEVVPKPPSNVIVLSMIATRNESEGLTVQNFIRTVPLKYKVKVVIIRQADRMNAYACNALLKMLEEPQPYVRFLLTSSRPAILPATIVSRCVSVACRPREDEELTPLLQLYGRSPEHRARVSERESAYAAMHEFFQQIPQMRPTQGLQASLRFRELAEKLPGHNQRECVTEGLRLLALWLLDTRYALSQGKRLAEVHRRVQGNANAGMQLDPFFCQLLRENVDSRNLPLESIVK